MDPFSSDALYGADYALEPSNVVALAPAPQPTGERVGDLNDPSDRGPVSPREDALFWAIAILALGTGIVGFRFHWGPGASASAKVDVGDEAASMLGNAFLTMAVIVICKWTGTKLDTWPGIQKFLDWI